MNVSIDERVNLIIQSLSQKDQARIVRVLELFKDYKFNLTEKFLKKLRSEIWELRTGKWRILFCLIKSEAVIVHIFMKKTQKTPRKEIDLALKRFNSYHGK